MPVTRSSPGATNPAPNGCLATAALHPQVGRVRDGETHTPACSSRSKKQLRRARFATQTGRDRLGPFRQGCPAQPGIRRRKGPATLCAGIGVPWAITSFTFVRVMGHSFCNILAQEQKRGKAKKKLVRAAREGCEPQNMPKAPVKAAPVPERVLKKRKAQEAIAAAKAAKLVEDKKASRIERKSIMDKAAKYAAEYKAEQADIVAKRRDAKKQGNFYMEPEPKVMLVVRIKGINAVDPKTRKILQLMRLRQVKLRALATCVHPRLYIPAFARLCRASPGTFLFRRIPPGRWVVAPPG